MHIHIIGICGTFMGGIAALARAAGHRVTGSDQNVYPPMSDQLTAMGIDLIQGYDPDQLKLNPDVVVVGNVMSRGNALIEALLDSELPYTSGPEWLSRHVLNNRHVMAVAGTHGKTTTTSILTWILEHSGREPGFLVGGVPGNFNVTARLGTGKCFVVEADEYDTAFFDKRAKFVHYHPRTAILNNLEHDHADIYPDVAAIQKQFHLLLRTVPRNGRLVMNADEPNLQQVIEMGCWTPIVRFSATQSSAVDDQWSAVLQGQQDGSHFIIKQGNTELGEVQWNMLGRHNAANALASVIAAEHVGVTVDESIAALKKFDGVKRRMEVRGIVNGITVYDDFAHHPTAIETTMQGLRRKAGNARIIAVLEPRSNTMKLGIHREPLKQSLRDAQQVWLYQGPDVKWDVSSLASELGSHAYVHQNIDDMVNALIKILKPGDHVLIMSNGGFGGIHTKLLAKLQSGAMS